MVQLLFATPGNNPIIYFPFRYVETDKNFEEYLYLYYLIFTLSRLGPNGLAFILPLLKARFASFLINLETTPSKSDCLKNQDLQKLAEIFSPLIMVALI